jgi:hypothetical protein
MGLREEIEAAFGEAAADGGVRLLAIEGDDQLWVGARSSPTRLSPSRGPRWTRSASARAIPS